MASPVTFIKEHPLGAALGVFAIGAAVIILRHGSGGGAVTMNGYDPQAAEVNAANQLQMFQGAQATQQNHDVLAAQVANNGIAAQITMAQLNGQTSTNNATLSADVAKTLATMQASTQQTVSALQAHIAEIESNNNLAATKAAIEGEVDIASLPYLNANADFFNKLNSLSGKVDTLSGKVNNAMSDLTGVHTSLNTTNEALRATISDLDHWSQRYEGGTIAPVNNANLLPGSYVTTVNLPS